ncbi:MAG: hypothetical protein LBM25_04020 [Bacteroidales bacterium]|nr:hypothetical protein [Bacteroidales bacterium]
MKKTFFFIFIFCAISLFNSNKLMAQEIKTNQNNKEKEEKLKPWTDIIKNNADPASWKWDKDEYSRFTIRGDWDGDGFDEMLYESATKLFSDNDAITPLELPGNLGVFFLINEGDLDGDGTDEISFMSVNRDYSNLNVIRVWTYTGNRWKELFQLPVHIWDCPNYNPKTPEESFTHQWKRKNKYSLNKVVLKKHDGIIDVIGINPDGRYAIEEIKIIRKIAAKRKWGMIIQPEED